MPHPRPHSHSKDVRDDVPRNPAPVEAQTQLMRVPSGLVSS